MSESVGSGGAGGDGLLYDPDEGAPARLYVDGQRVPIVNDGVRCYERKSGPMDVTRAADVIIPSQGLGVDWPTLVESNVNAQYVPALLELRDETTGEYHVVLRGYVGGIGGGGSTGNDMGLRILGPSQLLDIPASVTFKRRTPTDDVIDYVVETFGANQPLFDEISVATGTLDEFATRYIGSEAMFGLGGDETTADPMRFKESRDTLADVIAWFREGTGTRLWFEPTDDGITLVVLNDPHGEVREATHLGGDVDVLSNDALARLSPPNTLTLVGVQNHQVKTPIRDIAVPLTGGNYPVATAYSPTLVERAGGHITRTETASYSRQGALGKAARSRLKDILDSPSGGRIRTELTPSLEPYVPLRSKPVSLKEARGSAPSITYEIERVTHRAMADEHGVREWSDCEVSLYAPLHDIEVETELREVSPDDGDSRTDYAIAPSPTTGSLVDETS
ncbi:MAG: hypothetical protein ABEI11_03325 [Haloarculaceae archaeon]